MPLRCQRLAVLFILAWSSCAIAQDRHSDFQIWTSTSATISLGDHVEARVDALVQVTDDVSHAGRELARVIVLAKLSDHVKLGGGYLWTAIEPSPGMHFTEHRAVQEFDFRAPLRRSGLIFSARTMMEERWRIQQTGTSLRWRQLARLDVPLGPSGVGAVFWDEYFHEFRQTPWSGRAGPSLMINFVGIHVPITSTIAVEPGYLNQTQFDFGPNRVRHAFAVYSTARF